MDEKHIATVMMGAIILLGLSISLIGYNHFKSLEETRQIIDIEILDVDCNPGGFMSPSITVVTTNNSTIILSGIISLPLGNVTLTIQDSGMRGNRYEFIEVIKR